MARKKRASGEGTIRKRPNGLWEARLSISGQYRTKSFYGKTQADARRKREEARKALEAGHSLNSQRQTVGEYLQGWIEGPLKGSVAPKTSARDAEPPPRGPKKERPTLSLEQVANFFKAAAEAESRFEALFIVAV